MTTIVLNVTKDTINQLLVETTRDDIPILGLDCLGKFSHFLVIIGKFAHDNNISFEQQSFFCPVDYQLAKKIFIMLIQWEQYAEENLKTCCVDFCSSLKVWNIELYEECINDIYSNKYFKNVSFN